MNSWVLEMFILLNGVMFAVVIGNYLIGSLNNKSTTED